MWTQTCTQIKSKLKKKINQQISSPNNQFRKLHHFFIPFTRKDMGGYQSKTVLIISSTLGLYSRMPDSRIAAGKHFMGLTLLDQSLWTAVQLQFMTSISYRRRISEKALSKHRRCQPPSKSMRHLAANNLRHFNQPIRDVSFVASYTSQHFREIKLTMVICLQLHQYHRTLL